MKNLLLILLFPLISFAYRPVIDDLMKNIQYEESERDGALVQMKITNVETSEIFDSTYYLNDHSGRRELFQEVQYSKNGDLRVQSVYSPDIMKQRNLFLSIINSIVKGDASHLRNIFKVGTPDKQDTKLERKDKKFVWINKVKDITFEFDVMTKRLERAEYFKDDKKISFEFKNYRMYNSTHIFPEIIEFSLNDEQYVARTTQFKFFNLNSSEYREVQNRYSSAVKSFGEDLPGIFK